jgi:hypothetical protein
MKRIAILAALAAPVARPFRKSASYARHLYHGHGSRRTILAYWVRAAIRLFTFGTPIPVTMSYPGPALKAPLLPTWISRKQPVLISG